MSPATDQLIGLLARAGADQGVRRVVTALRRSADKLADQLDHYAALVDTVGPAEAARLIVTGYRGGLTG
jgi:hypothetical protein